MTVTTRAITLPACHRSGTSLDGQDLLWDDRRRTTRDWEWERRTYELCENIHGWDGEIDFRAGAHFNRYELDFMAQDMALPEGAKLYSRRHERYLRLQYNQPTRQNSKAYGYFVDDLTGERVSLSSMTAGRRGRRKFGELAK